MKRIVLLLCCCAALAVRCKKPSELVYDNPYDAKNPQGQVLLLSGPHGGNTWQSGTYNVISWSGQNIDSVRISLSLDDGANWTDLTVAPFWRLSYSYLVPSSGQRYDKCRVKISDSRDGDPSEMSITPFVISPVKRQ